MIDPMQALIPEGAPRQSRLALKDLLRLSVRAFRVRPMRTFLTILGIALGIGTVFFLVSLGYGLQYITIGQLASTEDSLVSIEAFYPSESNLAIRPSEVEEVKRLEHVSEVSPVAEFPGEISAGPLSGVVTVRIAIHNYLRLSGNEPDIGSFTGHGKGLAIASRSALKLLDLPEDKTSIGRPISIRVFYQEADSAEVQTVENQGTLTLSGIINDENELPYVIVEPSAFPAPPPFYQRMFVKAHGVDDVELVRDHLIERGYLISARIDLVKQAQKIMTAITIVLGIFGVTALVVSAIGMLNTMVISFLERIFEVGIMKSIGATTEDIRNLFLVEATVIGLLGGIGGIVLGVVAGEIVNIAINLLARYLGGKPVDLFIYPLQFFIIIIVLSGLVGALSGWWPARRAAKLSAREAFLRK